MHIRESDVVTVLHKHAVVVKAYTKGSLHGEGESPGRGERGEG